MFQRAVEIKGGWEDGHRRKILKSTGTVCPRSYGPFYIVTYYIEWVTTSWTYSMSSKLLYKIV